MVQKWPRMDRESEESVEDNGIAPISHLPPILRCERKRRLCPSDLQPGCQLNVKRLEDASVAGISTAKSVCYVAQTSAEVTHLTEMKFRLEILLARLREESLQDNQMHIQALVQRNEQMRMQYLAASYQQEERALFVQREYALVVKHRERLIRSLSTSPAAQILEELDPSIRGWEDFVCEWLKEDEYLAWVISEEEGLWFGANGWGGTLY